MSDELFCVLRDAIEQNDIAAARNVLEAATDEGEKQRGINHFLPELAGQGREDFVGLFLEHGADIEKKVMRETPLIEAIRGKHVAIVKLLLEKGANTETNISTMAGTKLSALDVAMGEDTPENQEIVMLLLRFGGHSTAPGYAPLLSFTQEHPLYKLKFEQLAQRYMDIIRENPNTPVTIDEAIILDLRKFESRPEIRDKAFNALQTYFSEDITAEKLGTAALVLTPKNVLGKRFLESGITYWQKTNCCEEQIDFKTAQNTGLDLPKGRFPGL